MPPHHRRRWGSHARSSVTEAHEQRLEHGRRQEGIPRRHKDRPIYVRGRLFCLKLCRFCYNPISVREPSYDKLSVPDKPPSTHGLERGSRTSNCKQNPQSARRNNCPGKQISQRFLLFSENLSALNFPGSAYPLATVLEQVAEGLDVEGTLVRRQGQFRLVLSITSSTRSVAVAVEASDVESLTH